MDTRKADIAAMIGRGAAGALPLLGPMLNYFINDMIPNQRLELERLWNLFNSLESKVNELEKEKIEQKINDPKSIDLFEDACHQATRALSPERTEKIASLLKMTLTKDQLDFMESKRLFAIFAEVNDAQIIILKSKGYKITPLGKLLIESVGVSKSDG